MPVLSAARNLPLEGRKRSNTRPGSCERAQGPGILPISGRTCPNLSELGGSSWVFVVGGLTSSDVKQLDGASFGAPRPRLKLSVHLPMSGRCLIAGASSSAHARSSLVSASLLRWRSSTRDRRLGPVPLRAAARARRRRRTSSRSRSSRCRCRATSSAWSWPWRCWAPLPAAVARRPLEHVCGSCRDRPRRHGRSPPLAARTPSRARAAAWSCAAVADVLGVGRSDIAYVAPVVSPASSSPTSSTSASSSAGCKVLDGSRSGDVVRTVIVPLLPSDAAMVLLASLLVYAETAARPARARHVLRALRPLHVPLPRAASSPSSAPRSSGTAPSSSPRCRSASSPRCCARSPCATSMTARHSAAVARYTREIARAAGSATTSRTSPTPRACCTTSASSSCPTTSCWPTPSSTTTTGRRSACTPTRASKVVREVEGYGPVADIIWCHHERIDGKRLPARARRRRHPADLPDHLDRRHLRRR